MNRHISSTVASDLACSPSGIVTTWYGTPGSTSTPMPAWVTTVARRAPEGRQPETSARTPGPTSTS